LEAIDRSHAALENTQSAFARAFIELRVEEKRRRLEKARVKWLSEDRRPFTPEEQALVSRILRGRGAEVMVTGFNTELTRQDLQRLRDTEWLNDEVINFYLNLLKQRSDDRSKNANAKQKPSANEETWPRVHFLNTFFYPLLSDKGGYNYARVQKWTRRVDLFAMDRVVVPIHLGNHWCLAVINLQDRYARTLTPPAQRRAPPRTCAKGRRRRLTCANAHNAYTHNAQTV
jgi:Ulp1 family protease